MAQVVGSALGRGAHFYLGYLSALGTTRCERQVQCPHSWRGRPRPPHHAITRELAGRCDLEPQRIGYLALQRMLGQRAVGHVNATSRARGGRPRPSSI